LNAQNLILSIQIKAPATFYQGLIFQKIKSHFCLDSILNFSFPLLKQGLSLIFYKKYQVNFEVKLGQIFDIFWFFQVCFSLFLLEAKLT